MNTKISFIGIVIHDFIATAIHSTANTNASVIAGKTSGAKYRADATSLTLHTVERRLHIDPVARDDAVAGMVNTSHQFESRFRFIVPIMITVSTKMRRPQPEPARIAIRKLCDGIVAITVVIGLAQKPGLIKKMRRTRRAHVVARDRTGMLLNGFRGVVADWNEYVNVIISVLRSMGLEATISERDLEFIRNSK
jgi:hypothetical protein